MKCLFRGADDWFLEMRRLHPHMPAGLRAIKMFRKHRSDRVETDDHNIPNAIKVPENVSCRCNLIVRDARRGRGSMSIRAGFTRLFI